MKNTPTSPLLFSIVYWLHLTSSEWGKRPPGSWLRSLSHHRQHVLQPGQKRWRKNHRGRVQTESRRSLCSRRAMTGLSVKLRSGCWVRGQSGKRAVGNHDTYVSDGVQKRGGCVYKVSTCGKCGECAERHLAFLFEDWADGKRAKRVWEESEDVGIRLF